MPDVELIVVGNEVLFGMVVDTNSSYLCRVVRSSGRRVGHISVVADDLDAIGTELRTSLERNAELILICGGLGPTSDDLTLHAISQALNRPLELNSQALEIVTRRYAELASTGAVRSAEIDEARMKMARLPAGARAIDNPTGTAPAVALQVESSLIVALPGVPRELESIVEGPLQPLLREKLGPGGYRQLELIVDSADESWLAPLLKEIADAHPQAYVKSRARRFGADVKFLITVSATADSAALAAELAEGACRDLERALARAGIAAARQ